MSSVDLIASDLDGTFLSPDLSINPINLEAVQLAKEAGVKVVFATGRPARYTQPIQSLTSLDPILISSNGGVVSSLNGETIYRHYAFDPADTLSALTDVASELDGISVCAEYVQGWARTPGFPQFAEFYYPTVEGTIAEIVDHAPIIKVLVKSETVPTSQLLQLCREIIGDRLTCTSSFIDELCTVELSAAGVTKGTTLNDLLAGFGIDPARVAAFGDMPNDVDMLAQVGQPYIMASAHPQLQAYGYPVAGTNEDGGVGRTIKKLLAD